jgi:hypothetical protein
MACTALSRLAAHQHGGGQVSGTLVMRALTVEASEMARPLGMRVRSRDEEAKVPLPALSAVRGGGLRRARDRLSRSEGSQNRTLASKYELQNLLLFVDDDLRETARAMENIEGFLVEALHLLEREDLTRDDLVTLTDNEEVFDELDQLGDTLTSLRSRMVKIAQTLK